MTLINRLIFFFSAKIKKNSENQKFNLFLTSLPLGYELFPKLKEIFWPISYFCFHEILNLKKKRQIKKKYKFAEHVSYN